jgi:hypothetical protein
LKRKQSPAEGKISKGLAQECQGPSQYKKKKTRLSYHSVYDNSEEDSLSIKMNDFVIVKFQTSKKVVKYYVGLIQALVADGNEFVINFLRRSGQEFFTFPEKDDISVIDKGDVVFILCQPNLNNNIENLISNIVFHKIYHSKTFANLRTNNT